jgi:hypothetical protein
LLLRCSIAASLPVVCHEKLVMKKLAAPLRELAGLFVEDGALALTTIAVVGLAGIVASLAPQVSWLSGCILLFGCLSVLILNVWRSKQR